MDAKAQHLRWLREQEAGREVFVRPLPLESTVDDVQKMLLKKCGEVAIDRVKLLKHAGGTLMSAFVILSTDDEARSCTQRLNGATYRGQVLAASVARNREGAKKAKELCMFFLEGKCQRGDSCQFLHKAQGEGGRRLPPCRFFAAGGCSRGEQCKFSHERQEPDEEASEDDAPAGKDSRKIAGAAEQPSSEDEDESTPENKKVDKPKAASSVDAKKKSIAEDAEEPTPTKKKLDKPKAASPGEAKKKSIAEDAEEPTPKKKKQDKPKAASSGEAKKKSTAEDAEEPTPTKRKLEQAKPHSMQECTKDPSKRKKARKSSKAVPLSDEVDRQPADDREGPRRNRKVLRGKVGIKKSGKPKGKRS